MTSAVPPPAGLVTVIWASEPSVMSVAAAAPNFPDLIERQLNYPAYTYEDMPFGGIKKSGYGREMGFEAMREYTQPKSVWVNVDAQIPPHFVR